MARSPLLPGGRPLRLVEHASDSLVLFITDVFIGFYARCCLAIFMGFCELIIVPVRVLTSLTV